MHRPFKPRIQTLHLLPFPFQLLSQRQRLQTRVLRTPEQVTFILAGTTQLACQPLDLGSERQRFVTRVLGAPEQVLFVVAGALQLPRQTRVLEAEAEDFSVPAGGGCEGEEVAGKKEGEEK
ncbi:MAG: hypothetical protein Q9195_003050 [Heterodermia aff. obscurata]